MQFLFLTLTIFNIILSVLSLPTLSVPNSETRRLDKRASSSTSKSDAKKGDICDVRYYKTQYGRPSVVIDMGYENGDVVLTVLPLHVEEDKPKDAEDLEKIDSFLPLMIKRMVDRENNQYSYIAPALQRVFMNKVTKRLDGYEFKAGPLLKLLEHVKHFKVTTLGSDKQSQNSASSSTSLRPPPPKKKSSGSGHPYRRPSKNNHVGSTVLGSGPPYPPESALSNADPSFVAGVRTSTPELMSSEGTIIFHHGPHGYTHPPVGTSSSPPLFHPRPQLPQVPPAFLAYTDRSGTPGAETADSLSSHHPIADTVSSSSNVGGAGVVGHKPGQSPKGVLN